MVDPSKEVAPSSARDLSRFPACSADQIDQHQVLTKPHYELVSHLQQESRCEYVAQILDAMSVANVARAALVFTDLSALTRNAEYMKQVLDCCSYGGQLTESINILPTYDAIACRRDVLGQELCDASRVSIGAMYAVMREKTPRYRYEELAPSLKKLLIGRQALFESKPSNALSYCQRQAAQYCSPLVSSPRLGARNSALLEQFYTNIAAEYFPIARYGYGCSRQLLEPADRKADMWIVKNPNRNLDLPEGAAHQCVDSASAARSFFVSCGIPADVYHVNVYGCEHNVAVVFFPHESPYVETSGDSQFRYVPVVVDASPWGARYPVQADMRGSSVCFHSPLGIQSVHKHRTQGLPFIDGDFRDVVGQRGLLPWCVREVPSQFAVLHGDQPKSDRIMVFAGVSAMQQQYPRIERGDPRWHGRGERTPRIAFAVSVISESCCEQGAARTWEHQNVDVEVRDITSSERVSLAEYAVALLPETGCKLVLTSQGKRIPVDVQQRVVDVVRDELPKVREFLERIGYPMHPRVFRSQA
jgi:hypothetical protein